MHISKYRPSIIIIFELMAGMLSYGQTIRITEVTSLDMTTPIGTTTSKTITVSGVNLINPIALSIAGADASQFSVVESSLPLLNNSVDNTTVTINYSPTAAGVHTADLAFMSTAPEITVFRILNGNTNTANHENNNFELKFAVSNGKIFFTAKANEEFQIYNVIGACLLESKTKEGLNTIDWKQHGIFMIKIANKHGKIII